MRFPFPNRTNPQAHLFLAAAAALGAAIDTAIPPSTTATEARKRRRKCLLALLLLLDDGDGGTDGDDDGDGCRSSPPRALSPSLDAPERAAQVKCTRWGSEGIPITGCEGLRERGRRTGRAEVASVVGGGRRRRPRGIPLLPLVLVLKTAILPDDDAAATPPRCACIFSRSKKGRETNAG